ncbi:EscU/YscU/HrcU family type III secretion system export apparatus switch protein [Paenibacillus septentrionalis]|uniref:EscU/YscU/HrcU family type III secretion system export apparatus switch protein n=1 Tax=Paenibacillus septentrionalis TaxID=429342 RepID=UPI00362F3982
MEANVCISIGLVVDLQLFNQEKTEKRHRKKSRNLGNKGQVAKSQELPAALILMLSFASFLLLGDYYKTHFNSLFTDIFENWLTIGSDNYKFR